MGICFPIWGFGESLGNFPPLPMGMNRPEVYRKSRHDIKGNKFGGGASDTRKYRPDLRQVAKKVQSLAETEGHLSLAITVRFS